ncbi:hypothetical protein ElyMa_004456500 [Elysia marginata]|uniref:Uncharacterized protein n=1 Tax=Elysia marginata TaxID=1093978 RepID=A0AAV4HEL2_9GAST|nr:hypothetical protein ElyMa_004456500 [Elysia marginata]
MSHSRVMSSSSSPALSTSSVHEDLPMSVPAREEHDLTTSEPMPAQTPAREPAPATALTPRPRKSPGMGSSRSSNDRVCEFGHQPD